MRWSRLLAIRSHSPVTRTRSSGTRIVAGASRQRRGYAPEAGSFSRVWRGRR
jgi:hypothetical protein